MRLFEAFIKNTIKKTIYLLILGEIGSGKGHSFDFILF